MQNKNKILQAAFVITGLIFLNNGMLAAQPLNEILSLAYKNNPALQAQRSMLRSADEGLAQASGGFRPSVNVNGNANWLKPYYNKNSNSRDFYSMGIGITQNIYNGGGTTASVKKADANIMVVRAKLQSSVQSILLKAATAYMNMLRDQSVLELNFQNEIRLYRQLEATTDRFEVGEVTRTDLSQAESRVSGAQADSISAEGQLDVSRALFKQLVGVEPTELSSPKTSFSLPNSLEEAVSLAINNHPNIKISLNELNVAKQELKIQQAGLSPSFSLSGDANYNHDVAGNNLRGKELKFTAAIKIPLYQAGIAKSQIRQAKQLLEMSNYQFQDANNKVVEAATAAWKILKTKQARIISFNDQVRASSIALDGVEQEATVGSRTVLDVLDAEQELLDARVNLVRTKRDEIVAKFELLNAIGSLNITTIGVNYNGYDEISNYNDIKDNIWGIDDVLVGE